jgi:hypothetical protein
VERLGGVAAVLVHGRVSGPPQVMKERALGRSDDVPLEEAIDERLLGLVRQRQETDLRSRALGEHLGEEAQLRDAGRRVAREVLLGLRGEGHEARVVMREIGEVRRGMARHRVCPPD